MKEFKRQVKPTVEKVRRSEHLLAKGQHTRAVRVARGAFAKIHQVRNGDKAASMYDRAQRAAAVSAVREDGKVNLGRGMNGKTEEGQALNRAWAVAVLQYQAARYPDNLVIQAQYAEALSEQPGQQDYAYDLLREMANDDLMPTARGYALLASLQQTRGDDVGRDASLARCRDLGADEPTCSIA